MSVKYSRIIAGIVIGCVLAIACVGTLGRDTSQEGIPKAAQYDEECMALLWGGGYCVACGSYSYWPTGISNQIRYNYTVCAGYDHAINITWNANGVYPTYVNVSVGTTLLARNGSGTIFLPYNQLPADRENVTFVNDNGTWITHFEYEILLSSAIPKPQETSTVPLQGTGIAIAIIYAVVILLGIASPKLPLAIRVIALLANIAMPIVWFNGLNTAKVDYGGASDFYMENGEPIFTDHTPTPFTIPEGGGLVLFATIDFQIDDPLYVGFDFSISKANQSFEMSVYLGEFGCYSGFTGQETETAFLPLPAGEYVLYLQGVSERMEMGIYVLGPWADISPGTSIGMWRWAFLIIGICAMVISVIAIVKAVKDRKKGTPAKQVASISLHTVPSSTSGKMIDASFSSISSPVPAAPPSHVTEFPPTLWVCEACGKENVGNARFCSSCGGARKLG